MCNELIKSPWDSPGHTAQDRRRHALRQGHGPASRRKGCALNRNDGQRVLSLCFSIPDPKFVKFYSVERKTALCGYTVLVGWFWRKPG
jgi:hypothetical protein